MSIELEQAAHDKAAARKLSRQVLFYAAAFSTLLGALYLAGLMGRLIVNRNIHAVSSQDVQTISAVVALLWNVSLLILFAALRRQAARSRRPFGELALLFMLLVCATSSVSWFTELAVVPQFQGDGRSLALPLLSIYSPRSITYAMEHLGWGLFFGLAALFAGAATPAGRLCAWIRWLFVAAGILSLLHFVGVIAASVTLADLGYPAWGLLLPITTALLAMQARVTGNV